MSDFHVSNRRLREMAPLRFYFLRHAVSSNNATLNDDERGVASPVPNPKKPPRRADPDITEKGAKAAQLAGQYFKRLNEDPAVPQYQKVDRVYSSLMTRALKTVKATELAPPLKFFALPELHEEGGLFHGPRDQLEDEANLAHGLTKDQISQIVRPLNLDDIATFEGGGWYPGRREPDEAIESRAVRIVDRIWKMTEEHFSQPDEGWEGRPGVLVITHGLIHDRVKRLLISGGSMPESSTRDSVCVFPTSNCGIDIFELKFHPLTRARMMAVVQLNNDGYLDSAPHLKNGHTCGAFQVRY